jgi:hypothetical protein
VIVLRRSNLAVAISSILAYNHNQDNHLDSISGIRTGAIEIVNVFEMEFHWEKDIWFFSAENYFFTPQVW